MGASSSSGKPKWGRKKKHQVSTSEAITPEPQAKIPEAENKERLTAEPPGFKVLNGLLVTDEEAHMQKVVNKPRKKPKVQASLPSAWFDSTLGVKPEDPGTQFYQLFGRRVPSKGDFERKIHFSADLSVRAEALLKFLKARELNALALGWEAEYLDFLYHQHKKQKKYIYVLPPPEIHEIWVTHMLRSADYSEFCNRHFGRVIEHDILLTTKCSQISTKWARASRCPFTQGKYFPIYNWQRETFFHAFKAFLRAGMPRELMTLIVRNWNTAIENTLHPEPKFIECLPPVDEIRAAPAYIRGMVLDIPQDPQWVQAKQVRSDRDWLPNLKRFHPNIKRKEISGFIILYKKFLFINWKHPETTQGQGIRNQVDLIWHSHMLLPTTFQSDHIRLLGRVKHHAPKADKKTKEPNSGIMREHWRMWEEEDGDESWEFSRKLDSLVNYKDTSSVSSDLSQTD